MKTTIRDNVTHLPYSLHDMSVTGFEVEGDRLVLQFANGFVKIGDPCEQINGSIAFQQVDWDFCYAYVLDFCGNAGSFTGSKASLADFIAQNKNVLFEIADETYGYNQSKFSGYLSVARSLKECTLEIYHLGDMQYVTSL